MAAVLTLLDSGSTLRRTVTKPPKLRRAPVRSLLGRTIAGAGLPSFSASGSLTGMRKIYGWDKAYPVRVGSWIYNCAGRKELYDQAR
jgi:hypothetical protein